MVKFNINKDVIIYPSEIGWRKIRQLIDGALYSFTGQEERDEYIKKRTTPDGGYKDQLWSIMKDFGHELYNGSNFLEHTTMELDMDEELEEIASDAYDAGREFGMDDRTAPDFTSWWYFKIKQLQNVTH